MHGPPSVDTQKIVPKPLFQLDLRVSEITGTQLIGVLMIGGSYYLGEVYLRDPLFS